MRVHELRRGSKGPSLKATLTTNGVVQNLTGATVVLSLMRLRTGGLTLSAGAVALEDAANGVVRHDWGDTTAYPEGLHRAEFKVTGLSPTPVLWPSGDQDEEIFVHIVPPVNP